MANPSLNHPVVREGHVAALFVSPVFVSESASAQGVPPLGVKGIREIVGNSAVPVYGLGGINCDSITRLHDCGLAGVGAVDAFSLKD
ncbi:MAG: thiamine phosphate synthase [Asticcacaulis sp.]